MNTKSLTTLTLLTAWACSSAWFCSPASAGNWPHWRGDDGNGVSSTATPPTEWSDTTNVKWKVPVPGLGSGSPIVWENRVFVTTAVAVNPSRQSNEITKLSFEVYCFDRETGKELWWESATNATPHEGTHRTNNFAPASPCTDGERLYVSFGSRGLYCYTLDGELVWQRTDLGEMSTRNEFGEGSSPTLVGDKLLVPWDHEGPSALYALDKLTGETVWRVDRDEPTNWCTPLVIEHDGTAHVVITGQTAIRSHDLITGEELWRHANVTQRPVASPVGANGMVYAGHGFRGSFMGAFYLGGRGDLAGTKFVKWTKDNDTPDLASFVLSRNRLFFTKAKTGVLTCVSPLTGEPIFRNARLPKLKTLYASPVAAGGHLYVTGRSGTTVVVKDASELEVVSVNSIGETVDATPAPVDDELFIRSESHLWCIAE